MKGMTKQTRAGKDPRDVRVVLAGLPKVGKSTLASEWAPDTTLIVDTHNGTVMLDGEHYVEHIKSWEEFVAFVDKVTTNPPEGLRTIQVDLVDDIYRFADTFVAKKKNLVAAGLIEYGKGLAEAVGLFQREIGRLLDTSFGLWFLSHTDTVEEGQITRYVPRLDKRVRPFVEGACDFVLLAEALGPKRVLHTAPSAKFAAGSRVPLPEPMDMDARALYTAMAAGLAPKKLEVAA